MKTRNKLLIRWTSATVEDVNYSIDGDRVTEVVTSHLCGEANLVDAETDDEFFEIVTENLDSFSP
jgi:hypothetical protein